MVNHNVEVLFGAAAHLSPTKGALSKGDEKRPLGRKGNFQACSNVLRKEVGANMEAHSSSS